MNIFMIVISVVLCIYALAMVLLMGLTAWAFDALSKKLSSTSDTEADKEINDSSRGEA